jgi:thiol-disulfide isomerase/thioredoxin
MKYLILASMLFSFYSLSIASTSVEEIKPLEIGRSAPDFQLPGVDGRNYSLSSFKDARVLALVFICNHCPTAQAYEERIKKLVTDYGPKGVEIVAVSPNDPEAVRLDELGYSDLGDNFEEMKIRAKDMQYNFVYLYDGDNQQMSKAYGAQATPHIFIFDNERRLRYNGRIDNSEKPGTATQHDARLAIEALLAGKEVPVQVTKTFGCSIKWSDKRNLVQRAFENWAKEKVSVEDIDVQGIKELISNKSDKLRLINVWATWCGPCITEFPDFVSINRMYRGREFEFISISADKPDKNDKALAFLRQIQASGKNYIFNDNDVYKLIEAIDPDWQGALPYTLLIEPGGKILYKKQSVIDPLEMKKMIVDKLGRYY